MIHNILPLPKGSSAIQFIKAVNEWSSSKFGKGSRKAFFSKYIYIIPYPEDYEHSHFLAPWSEKNKTKERAFPILKIILIFFW